MVLVFSDLSFILYWSNFFSVVQYLRVQYLKYCLNNNNDNIEISQIHISRTNAFGGVSYDQIL